MLKYNFSKSLFLSLILSIKLCYGGEAYSGISENISKLMAAKQCIECDLEGVDLNRAKLNNANLSGSNLSNARFYLAELSGVNFQNSILKGAHFGGADLSKADFRGADLSEAMFVGAYTKGALFDKDVGQESFKDDSSLNNEELKKYEASPTKSQKGALNSSKVDSTRPKTSSDYFPKEDKGVSIKKVTFLKKAIIIDNKEAGRGKKIIQ